jgi:drug/metabolite transporter (DMT)-like permease
LSPVVLFVVLGAGGLHATWNAIAKSVDDRLVGFALIGAASTVTGGIALLVTGLPARAAFGYLGVSVVVHVAYEYGLMSSYRLGAFNQTYPMARGTSPLVVAVGAWWLAHEHLAALAWTGIVILALGLMSLAVSAGTLTRHDLPAVGAAVATGLAIAVYTLADGLGVRRSHDPYAYAALLFLLQGPVFPLVVLIRRRPVTWSRLPHVGRGLAAGLLSVVAYSAVLWAQTRAPLAEVAALRETSVIAAAVIGTVFMKERFGSRRVAAAVLVAVGILLIAT